MESDLGRQLNLYGSLLEVLGVLLSLAQLMLFDIKTSQPTKLGAWVEARLSTLGRWLRTHRAISAVVIVVVIAALTGAGVDEAVFGDDPDLAFYIAGNIVGFAILFSFAGYLLPRLSDALDYVSSNLRAC